MDETRRNFEQDMGSELGSLYWVLWNDWANARLRYEELTHLFNEMELGPWNVIGGKFLWDLQEVFKDDMILRICRMTDSASVGPEDRRKENASIEQLPARVFDLIKEARKAAKFAHKLRNRRIAHRDLVSAKHASTESHVSTLLPKMENALDAIQAVLGEINEGMANLVVYPPRFVAFVARVSQFVDGACLIDELLGPPGDTGEEIGMARSFLKTMGRDPVDMMDVMLLLRLREAAGWFRKSDPGEAT